MDGQGGTEPDRSELTPGPADKRIRKTQAESNDDAGARDPRKRRNSSRVGHPDKRAGEKCERDDWGAMKEWEREAPDHPDYPGR